MGPRNYREVVRSRCIYPFDMRNKFEFEYLYFLNCDFIHTMR
jgi:hypothetical protein